MCKHRFVAIPVTGMQLGGRGSREVLINGFKVRCQHCMKNPKSGDKVVEIRPSWYKQLYPKSVKIDYIMP